MTDGNKQVKGPAKTLRISTDMHERFRAFQHNVHANSAEEAMNLLLGDDVMHIPMPAAVMERWKAEATASGFPLEQWVAQRVEAWLANRTFAGQMSAAAYDIHKGEMPPAQYRFVPPTELISLEEAERRGFPAEGEHTTYIGPRRPKPGPIVAAEPVTEAEILDNPPFPAEKKGTCGECTTPNSCRIGGQNPEECE